MAGKTIPFNKPTISRKDMLNVLECMVHDEVNEGQITRKFEKKFAEFLGMRDSVMVNHVSSALYLIFFYLNIQEGDEIIISALAESWQLEVIRMFKAKAVLVDTAERSFTCSQEAIRRVMTEHTRAVIIPHTFGYPCLFSREEIAAEHEIAVIEDCSSSLGTRIGEEHTGLRGDYAVFSFSVDRMITSAQGGAVIARNKVDLQALRDYRSFKEHSEIRGLLDFSITDLQSAMAISELSLMNKFLTRRREIGEYFRECVHKGENTFLDVSGDHTFNFGYFPVQTASSLKISMEMFKKYKVSVHEAFPRPAWEMLGLPAENYPNAQQLKLKTLLLPLYPDLKKAEVLEIGKLISNIR